MASVNKVLLVGHLGKDPDVRFTPSGRAMCKFPLATSEVWNTDAGKQERTEWHRVHQKVGDHAARAASSIRKSGYQRRKVEDSSLFRVLTRVCKSKCAPRLLHCIDCCFTKRLLST